MAHVRLPTALAARAFVQAVSPNSAQRLSILIYHRVLAAPDPLRPAEPTRETFRWQMEAIDRVFNVLPLVEAVTRLRERSLPPRAAAITFDDGYADNAELALPLLRELGIPATVFVASGFLNGGRMFNDTVIEVVRRLPGNSVNLDGLAIAGVSGVRAIADERDRRALVAELLPHFKYAAPEQREPMLRRLTALAPGPLPDGLMMSDDQVRALHRAGVGIGAHTVTHPILANLDDDRVRSELRDSRQYLESLIEAPVELFAYPNGKPGEDYSQRDVELVRATGFAAAVSTRPQPAEPRSDPYQLPRFTPWGRTPTRFLARLALSRRARAGGCDRLGMAN